MERLVDRGEPALLSQANDLCSPHAVHVDDAAKLHLARRVDVDAALRLLRCGGRFAFCGLRHSTPSS
jgi:hypothetical protein